MKKGTKLGLHIWVKVVSEETATSEAKESPKNTPPIFLPKRYAKKIEIIPKREIEKATP